MTAWDFITIIGIGNELKLEFKVEKNNNGILVAITKVHIDDMADYINSIKDRTGLTPEIISASEDYDNVFILGYYFKE